VFEASEITEQNCCHTNQRFYLVGHATGMPNVPMLQYKDLVSVGCADDSEGNVEQGPKEEEAEEE
jgi:hypothetical protein